MKCICSHLLYDCVSMYSLSDLLTLEVRVCMEEGTSVHRGGCSNEGEESLILHIQSLIRVLVKLDHLKDLKLLFSDDAETLDEYKAIESITRSIVVNQYEFPVLKSFSCTLLMIHFCGFQSN